MEKTIQEETILMFIGPFSSGKSSFVNALLGEHLLPTANTPCTAVVTEISFKESGGDSGKIFKRSASDKAEEIDFEELKKIINGPSGASGEVASYDHVELCLDVSEKPSRKQFEPFIGRIRIVDCPGYGSPYFANEDIIISYIEKSNFTFWMTPHTKIGGAEAEKHLSLIKKNTSTLIPLITKADTIPNDDEREKIKDDYYDQLSSYFRSREPHFVSAIKFQEAVEEEQKLKKEGRQTSDTFEKLRIDSGIDWVVSAMHDCATKQNVNQKKVESLLFDVRTILKDLAAVAGKEKQYWELKLSEIGWNPDEKKYGELDRLKERTERWIKNEAKKFSDEFKNELTAELVNSLCDMATNIDPAKIQAAWNSKIDSMKEPWTAYFKNQYTMYIRSYMPQVDSDFDLKLKNSEIELVSMARNILDSVMEALKQSGLKSTLEVTLGAGMLASIPALNAVTGIIAGKAAAAAAGLFAVAGPVVIAMALIPLIPAITQGIRAKNERDKTHRENELRKYLGSMNVAPVIEQILGRTNKDIYDYIVTCLNSDLTGPKRNYDDCDAIMSGIQQELQDLAARFPDIKN